MRILLHLTCAALTVGLIARCAHWTNSFHYLTGLGTLLLAGGTIGSLCWLKSRSQPNLKPAKGVVHRVQDSPVRSVFLGVLTGLSLALCLWLSFGMFKQW